MKKRWMRELAMTMALALAMATPLQASELVSEDTTGPVSEAADDTGMGDIILPVDEIIPAEVVSEQNAAPVAEISEDNSAIDVVDISEMTSSDANVATIGTTSATLDEWNSGIVWLHVVNGNFSDTYNTVDISETPSVKVQLENYTKLPDNVKDIQVHRANGTFAGWYTEAPTEELRKSDDGAYSVWHTVKINGTEVKPGEKIPDGVHVLYAVFNDAEKIKDDDRRVEFYLDWNGIDGQFGKCLTCTDKYQEGGVYFTPDRAVVYNLNYAEGLDTALDAKLKAGDDEGKWELLKEFWENNTFNGYTFQGWSTDPEGNHMIWENTPITNGMSFYAQWQKGEESSKNFNRENPTPDLENIRIVAGEGTTFVSGTLSSSKDAKEGEIFRLNLFCTPVGAEAQDLTWSLTVRAQADSLADVFKSTNNAETGEVKAGEDEKEIGGVKAKAEGCTLTVTNGDGKGHVITVSATAKNTEEKTVSSPADVTLNFAHIWNAGEQVGIPDCENDATVTYTCTGCGEERKERIAPLGHVYSFNEASGDHYSVKYTKEPTCTEEGEKEYTYSCLRCGAPGEIITAKVPALGHDWGEAVAVPVSCNKDMVTKTCQREGCTAKEVSLVPASHPELHQWKETRRDHDTCKQDTVYETCEVCGETKKYTVAAENEHAFAYESSMRIDCEKVSYTFKCVYGCGTTEVKLKKEVGHDWDDWKVTTSWNKETGMMERVQEHSCKRCKKTEKEILESIVASQPETEPETSQAETETETSQAGAAQNTVQAAQFDGQTDDSADNDTVETAPVTAYAPASMIASSKVSVAKATPQTDVATAVAESAAVQTEEPKAQTRKIVKAGWKTVKGKKYYVGKSGKTKTGWQTIGKKKYYFDKNGVMKTGLKKIGKKKYYFGKNGVMRTGWQTIGKKRYYFGKNGAMKKQK